MRILALCLALYLCMSPVVAAPVSLTDATSNASTSLTVPAGITAALSQFSTSATTQGVVPGSNSAGATKFLNGNGGWTAPAGTASGFGGNGADGAITISSATSYAGPLQKNATTWTLNSGQTLTCSGSPVIINATGAVAINGTITCTAGSGGAGGAGAAAGVGGSSPGVGPGFGQAGLSTTAGGGSGGGGGANGGGGGIGGQGESAVAPFTGGGTAYFSSLIGGSGGGGGGSSVSVAGGLGGSGGLCLIVCAIGAVNLASTGVITNNGSAGANVSINAGGGGGGGGGTVWLISQTSSTTTAAGAITEKGNSGGNGYAGGGGGGGGHLILWSPSNTNSATGTYTAGSGGTGTSAGTAGAAGLATLIIGTPNLPLLTWMGLALPTDLASARTYGDGAKYLAKREAEARKRGEHTCYIAGDELARAYAQNDPLLYAQAVTSKAWLKRS